MSNPFKRWHADSTSTTSTSTSGSSEHLPSSIPALQAMQASKKRETVYLTPQQVRETMSEEDRAIITPWPERDPELGATGARRATGMQWTGTVGFQHSHTPLMHAAGEHTPEDLARTESPDPRTPRAASFAPAALVQSLSLPLAQAGLHSPPYPHPLSTPQAQHQARPQASPAAPSLHSHSSKPSASTVHSHTSPDLPTPRKGKPKPSLTSVLGFLPSPSAPPPVPEKDSKPTPSLSLPLHDHEPKSSMPASSYAGSDISLSPSLSPSASMSMSASTLAVHNLAIPTPYGSLPRARKRTSSSSSRPPPTLPQSTTTLSHHSASSSYSGFRLHESPKEGRGMFTRLRQKMSHTSLRPRQLMNGGEPIPPLPVSLHTRGPSSSSTYLPADGKRSSGPGPRTPPGGSFGSKRPSGGKKPKPKPKPRKDPRGPVREERIDEDAGGEGRTAWYEHVDFENLNPEEFMSFEVVGDGEGRGSGETLSASGPGDAGGGDGAVAAGPGEEGRGSGAAESALLGRPSLVRRETQTSMEFEIPDSWAVLTEEALAKEEGLESEAEESEEEEDGAQGGIVFLENSDWVELEGEGEEGEEEEGEGMRGPLVEGEEERVDEESAAKLYALRVYRPNGTWHVVACPLTATAYDIRNSMVERFGLENEGMIGRYRLFIVEKGQERMLMKKEKPLVILRRRLLTAGHTKLDKLTSQGGRELQHLCRFVLQMSLLHGLPEEHDGMFDHLQGLVKLDDVNLQTIPAELHKVAPHLVRLSLRHNPLTDLPKDFCMATTQLRELNLSRTALKRIPAAISYCTSLEVLDVSYNRIKSLDMTYGSLENLQQLKILRLHANVLSDLPASIQNLPLLELRMDMNRLEQLPSVVCKLHLLETLVLSHNDLLALPPGIGALTQLRVLALNGNKLQALPNELRYMTSLVVLSLSRNRVIDISVISTLQSLQHLEASHNFISSVALPFPKTLKVVNLESNTFTRFNPTSKSLMMRAILRKLDLSQTKLSSLQFDFGVFPDLQELILDDSRIGELPTSVIKLERLVKLSACNASLKHLPDAIGDLPTLTELLVHSNDLTSIPDSIWMCPSLVVFNASSNKLSAFPESPSGAVPPLVKSLKELYLADNRLADSVLLRLSLLRYISILNLSYNVLRDIPDGTLRCFTRLETLFLSGNALMAVRGEELPPTLTVKRLYLNNNRLQSLPVEIAKYTQLTVLDVGNNLLKYNINNFGYDYQWIWNEALRMLNLSGNKRLKIDKPHLTAKDRDKPHFNGADFRVFKDLQSLGLMDVTLAVTYLPEESDYCRIRTSASSLNGMRYGVSDSIGKDLMGSFDMAVPKYRGREEECLFGIFAREQPPKASALHSNALTRYLTTHFRSEFAKELLYIKRDPKLGEIPDAMRRAFLNLNKSFYDNIVNPTGLDIPIKSGSTFESGDPATRHPELQAGACACVAYLVDKALYIANVGNVEAFVGGDHGKMDVVTTLHGPFEAREAGRIKKAEEWVTPKGILKGDLKVSRAFGFYSRFPVVNPGPDIMKIQLSPDDQFLVIGNAEFWSYLKKDAAASIVRGHHMHGDGMSAAQELRDVALAHGASGNVQVMVVMLSDLFLSPSLGVESMRTPEVFDRRAGGSSMTLSARERMGSADDAPIGKVALVFTDIRNSTALWERLKGRMQYSLDMHNRCMRRIMRLCGGYEVKTEGDAFMVAFSSLLAAVHWCLEVQVQLLKENWPKELLDCADGKEVHDASGHLIERGISVRMGIHHGIPLCEPDPTTGRMDYLGIMVNRTARVNGSARGGEIMLSADVVKLLESYLDEPSPNGSNPVTTTDFLQSLSALSPDEQLHLEAIRELDPVLIGVGETKLKGIEQPEFLSLLFPKRLLGRHRSQSADSQGAPVVPVRSDADPDGLGVSKESIEALALVCTRLEALDAGFIFRLEEADNQPSPDSLSPPGTATPGASSRRSSETEQRILHGRQDELLPAIDYSDEVQVMQVLEGLIQRLEHSITRLRVRNAFSHPDVRQIMLDKVGFDPEELLRLFREMTAPLQRNNANWTMPRPAFA